MRQRRSFRATNWGPLEGRDLPSGLPTFPINLHAALGQFIQRNQAAALSGQQPQVIAVPAATPAGFIDSRVSLSGTDVAKLVASVGTLYAADRFGTNPAAVTNFRASLTALDRSIATEPQQFYGQTIHIAGATQNFLLPLANSGHRLTAFDVQQLHNDVDAFAAVYEATPRPTTAAAAVALARLENQMSLLILSNRFGM
jgi:hypothetical protein